MGDLYLASENRYEKMTYNRVGKSGLKFPAVSLGFWHNFGSKDNYDNMKAMCRKAFDLGITQFDLANNYGPVYGSAEENAGRILQEDFRPYRDELVITSKAGYDMWPGPYGDWGSKKYLTASIDQSLSRLQLEYVDILLSSPHGSGNSTGRNHGSSGIYRPQRQSPLCRYLQL